MRIETILRAYLECALWSSHDYGDGEEPKNLDDMYSVTDFDPAFVVASKADIAAFLADNEADLSESDLSETQVGHDFWLSRNGHGAGFFDHGVRPCYLRLQDAAQVYGEVNLYSHEGIVRA